MTKYQSQDQRSRYEEWASATTRRYRASTLGHCPRLVVRRVCRSKSVEELCICDRFHRLLDHSHMWQAPGGRRVLTAEPYNVEGDHLAAFVAECSDLGAVVSLSGSSPYFPGSTLLLNVHNEGTQS